MEAARQSVASYYCKLVNIIFDIIWAVNNRAASVIWAVAEYYDDVAPVAAVRLRAAAYKLQSIITGVNLREFVAAPRVRKIAAGVLAALILIFLPSIAASKTVTYTSDKDTEAAYTISRMAESIFHPGEQPAETIEYEFLSDEILPLTARGGVDESSIADVGDHSSLSSVDINEESIRSEGFEALGEIDGEATLFLMQDDIFNAILYEGADPDLLAREIYVDGMPVAQDASVDSVVIASLYGQLNDDPDNTLPVVDGESTAVSSGAAAQDADFITGHITDDGEDEIEGNAEPRPLTASTGIYAWPADGTLTSRFGYRGPNVGSTYHRGIDISGSTGQPIFAADGGEVIVSGWSNSYGYMVQIRHDNGHVTLYCHCSSLLVSVGERVRQGQQIAGMGRTGIADGVHLHFELSINGVQVDPLPHLQQARG